MTTDTPVKSTRVVFQSWGTPIYTAMLPEADAHNPILRDLILKAEATDTQAGNFGGIAATKSSQDILQWDHPSIMWLKAGLAGAVAAMTRSELGDAADEIASAGTIAEGWAVVYREGGSLRPHTHHDSVWSAVYYVESGTDPVAGDDGEAGYLQLLDPRPAAVARQVSSGQVRLAPKPGRILMFPGWLPHQVAATVAGDGSSLRICTAFNVAYDKEWTGMR